MIYPDKYTDKRLEIAVYGMHESGMPAHLIADQLGIDEDHVKGIICWIWACDRAAFRFRKR